MRILYLVLFFFLLPLVAFSQTRQLTLTPSVGLKLQNLDVIDYYDYFDNNMPLRPEMGLDLGYKLSRKIWLEARTSLVPLTYRLSSKSLSVADIYPEYNTTYWTPEWGVGVAWEIFRENRQSVQVGYQVNVNHLRARENGSYSASILADGLPINVTTQVDRTFNAFLTMNMMLIYEREISYNQSIVIYAGRTFGSSEPESHRFSFEDPSLARSFELSNRIENQGSGFFLRVGYRFYLIKQVKDLEF